MILNPKHSLTVRKSAACRWKCTFKCYLRLTSFLQKKNLALNKNPFTNWQSEEHTSTFFPTHKPYDLMFKMQPYLWYLITHVISMIHNFRIEVPMFSCLQPSHPVIYYLTAPSNQLFKFLCHPNRPLIGSHYWDKVSPKWPRLQLSKHRYVSGLRLYTYTAMVSPPYQVTYIHSIWHQCHRTAHPCTYIHACTLEGGFYGQKSKPNATCLWLKNR